MIRHVFQGGDMSGMVPGYYFTLRRESDSVACRGGRKKESPRNSDLGAFVRDDGNTHAEITLFS
jgi:hypothetical protein